MSSDVAPSPSRGRGRVDRSRAVAHPAGRRSAIALLVRIATDRPLLLICLIIVLVAVMAILEPDTFPRRQTRRSCFSTRPRPASWRAG